MQGVPHDNFTDKLLHLSPRHFQSQSVQQILHVLVEDVTALGLIEIYEGKQ